MVVARSTGPENGLGSTPSSTGHLLGELQGEKRVIARTESVKMPGWALLSSLPPGRTGNLRWGTDDNSGAEEGWHGTSVSANVGGHREAGSLDTPEHRQLGTTTVCLQMSLNQSEGLSGIRADSGLEKQMLLS